MRKPVLVLVIITLAFAGVLLAQDEPAQEEMTVPTILQKAIVNEHVAQLRYAAFASKAEEEGYLGAASLFRAAAAAEKIHEARFTALLKKRGGAQPELAAPEIEPASTRENLSASMEAEKTERDQTYHDQMAACSKLGDKEASALFDTARTAESEHANLMMSAMWDLENMKEARTYYVCDHCGFTSDVRLPSCPSCKRGTRLRAVK